MTETNDLAASSSKCTQITPRQLAIWLVVLWVLIVGAVVLSLEARRYREHIAARAVEQAGGTVDWGHISTWLPDRYARRVVSLQIGGAGVHWGPAVDSAAKAFPELQAILVVNQHLSLQEMQILARTPITELGLWTCSATPDSLAALRNSQIEVLRCIGWTSLGDGALKDIAAIRDLRSLDLGNSILTQSGVVAFAANAPPSLEELRLEGTNIGDPELEAIAGIASLRSLDASRTRISNQGLTRFAAHPPHQLQELRLSENSVGDPGALAVSRIQTLVRLDYGVNRATREALRYFARLPWLEELSFQGNNLAELDPSVFATYPSLKALLIGWTDQFGTPFFKHFTSADWDDLKSIVRQAIFEKEIATCYYDWEWDPPAEKGPRDPWDDRTIDASRFPVLPGLEMIDLSGLHIQNQAGLQQLAHSLSLRTIVLNDTNVDDAGIAALQGAPSLETLSLKRTNVTDACLPILTHLPKLSYVNFVETNLSAHAVQACQSRSGFQLDWRSSEFEIRCVIDN